MTAQTRADLSDGILTVTLDHPPVNAFTRPMLRELIAAFDRADADDAVRAVIVTGAGERAFCAGADLAGGADTFELTATPRRSRSRSRGR